MVWVFFVAVAVLVVVATAALALGRVEVDPVPPPATTTPEVGLVSGFRAQDIHDIRFDTALRGYRMDQVDEVLAATGLLDAQRGWRLFIEVPVAFLPVTVHVGRASVRTRAEILSAVAPANVSAQSPPCRKNASPLATWARRARSRSTSPANTRGGTALSSWILLAKSGCCAHWGC